MFLKSTDNLKIIYDQCTLQRGGKIKGIKGESKCRYCELKTTSSEKVQDQVLCSLLLLHLSIPLSLPPPSNPTTMPGNRGKYLYKTHSRIMLLSYSASCRPPAPVQVPHVISARHWRWRSEYEKIISTQNKHSLELFHPSHLSSSP